MGIRGGRRFIVGEQRAFACALPAGWLECNGAAVLRAAYPALFNAIGTTYGVGDGATTFNLPDKRGRSSISKGQGSGLTNRTHGQRLGAETVALSGDQNGPHSHGITSGGNTSSPAPGQAYDTGTAFNMQSATSGSGTAHQNMSPVEVDIWGIKY